MDDCLFCKIVQKQIPAEFVFESDTLVAFPDINPSADIHILIVPKEHISSVNDLGQNHGQLLIEVYQVASQLVRERGLDKALYRIVINGGKAQHIPHLHFHLLGGKWKRRV